MLTYEDEEDLLQDIKEGVSIALARTGLDSEGYVDDIKLNKLAYFAIQEYDLNITYGWYKYGPAPYFPEGKSNRGNEIISPQTPDAIQAVNSSRVPTPGEKYLSPVEYSYFFTDDIFDEFQRVVTSETKNYLVSFYEDNAPSTYRSLYIESAKLQQTLDEIQDDADWIESTESVYTELEEGLQNVQREMLLVPEVNESVSAFNDYKKFMKNVMVAVVEKDDLTPDEQQFVEKLVSFFYDMTWNYTANIISSNTVTGENAEDLRDSIEADLRELRNRHDRALKGLQERASEFGLLPAHVEEMPELIEYEDTFPPQENEDEVIDEWSRLGAEVIYRDGSQ